jgi:hypothetical protein
MTTAMAMPAPMPAFAPVDSPLEPVTPSEPARAVGVVVYDEALVIVAAALEAITTSVMVV